MPKFMPGFIPVMRNLFGNPSFKLFGGIYWIVSDERDGWDRVQL